MAKKKEASKEKYVYNVLGTHLRMKPMKMRQIRDFVAMFSDLRAPDKEKKEFNFKALTKLLFAEKLKEVAIIVFGGEAANIQWDEVEYEIIDRMLEDFFDLNPSLIARLKELANTFVLSR